MNHRKTCLPSHTPVRLETGSNRRENEQKPGKACRWSFYCFLSEIKTYEWPTPLPASAQPHLRCSSQDSLAHVRDLMSRYDVRHVPVIDNGRPAGVISLRDIIAAVDEASVDTAQAA